MARTPKMTVEEELNLRFTYHTPKPDQPERYERIRNKARELALVIFETTPSGPEQVRAVDRLDEVVMLANAAIARGEATG